MSCRTSILKLRGIQLVAQGHLRQGDVCCYSSGVLTPDFLLKYCISTRGRFPALIKYPLEFALKLFQISCHHCWVYSGPRNPHNNFLMCSKKKLNLFLLDFNHHLIEQFVC